MAIETYIHDGNDWRKTKRWWANDSTAWRDLKKAYCHDGTDWRLVFKSKFWRKLTALPTGVIPKRVIIFEGKITVGTTAGVYQYSSGTWTSLGLGSYEISSLIDFGGVLHAGLYSVSNWAEDIVRKLVSGSWYSIASRPHYWYSPPALSLQQKDGYLYVSIYSSGGLSGVFYFDGSNWRDAEANDFISSLHMVVIGSKIFCANGIGEITDIIRDDESFVDVSYNRYYCRMNDISVLSGKIAAVHRQYSNIPASLILWNGSSWDIVDTFTYPQEQRCLCTYQNSNLLVSGGDLGILIHTTNGREYVGNNGMDIFPYEIISGTDYMVSVSPDGVFVYDEDQDDPAF